MIGYCNLPPSFFILDLSVLLHPSASSSHPPSLVYHIVWCVHVAHIWLLVPVASREKKRLKHKSHSPSLISLSILSPSSRQEGLFLVLLLLPHPLNLNHHQHHLPFRLFTHGISISPFAEVQVSILALLLRSSCNTSDVTV